LLTLIVPALGISLALVRRQRRQRDTAVAAKSKIDIGLRQFPMGYWRYLLVTAVFGLGNSSTAFLILRAQEADASLRTTILQTVRKLVPNSISASRRGARPRISLDLPR
jgi:hypothetical protein